MRRGHIKFLNAVLIIIVSVIMFILICCMTVAADDRDTHISVRAQTACEDYGLAYNISPELLEAIVEAESGGGTIHSQRLLCGSHAGQRALASR